MDPLAGRGCGCEADKEESPTKLSIIFAPPEEMFDLEELCSTGWSAVVISRTSFPGSCELAHSHLLCHPRLRRGRKVDTDVFVAARDNLVTSLVVQHDVAWHYHNDELLQVAPPVEPHQAVDCSLFVTEMVFKQTFSGLSRLRIAVVSCYTYYDSEVRFTATVDELQTLALVRLLMELHVDLVIVERVSAQGTSILRLALRLENALIKQGCRTHWVGHGYHRAFALSGPYPTVAMAGFQESVTKTWRSKPCSLNILVGRGSRTEDAKRRRMRSHRGRDTTQQD